MSDLSFPEKRKLEQLFDMSSGYVLNFSHRTLNEFIHDVVNLEFEDPKYNKYGESKAKKLRCLWKIEPNYVVGKLIERMIEYGQNEKCISQEHENLINDCKSIAARLLVNQPVPEIDSLKKIGNGREIDMILSQIRDSIDKNKPEEALDRLHTAVIHYIRELAKKIDIKITQDKPLHSLFGEYVKKLKELGMFETTMTESILKSNISLLDSFNEVRNNKSFAHANSILNYDESLLIVNNVINLIRFISSVEKKLNTKVTQIQFTKNLNKMDDDFIF